MKNYPEMEKVKAIPEHDRELISQFIDHIQDELGIITDKLEYVGQSTRLDVVKRYTKDEIWGSFFGIDSKEFHKQQEAAFQEAIDGQRKMNEEKSNGR